MKTTLLLLIVLFTLNLKAQEIKYSKNYTRIIIKSDKTIENISFRKSTNIEHVENKPTNYFNVKNKIFVIQVDKINDEADEIVIFYINETVILEF